MKENSLSIEINRSASEIFRFVLNPANTHLWIDDIVREETNESPARIGTEYRSLNKRGKWSAYVIVLLETDVMFEMKQKDGPYHVRYTFEPLSDERTRLTYFEWADEGRLKEPFPPIVMERLKKIVERRPGTRQK